MATDLERVIEAWDGEQVVVRFDATSGTWMSSASTRGVSARPVAAPA